MTQYSSFWSSNNCIEMHNPPQPIWQQQHRDDHESYLLCVLQTLRTKTGERSCIKDMYWPPASDVFCVTDIFVALSDELSN